MASLSPLPFGALVTRMFRELEARQRIFDLPVSAVVRPEAGLDYAVGVHGRLAATPFGPAAGPHTQLAPNIVLSWLAGGRVIELKTIQANDRIQVPRPCIDVRTVGFNVEWSQELSLEQSLEEYVKASMLIEMLAASGRLDLPPGFERAVFDLSVGYDLAGITSERVRGCIHALCDARPVIDRLRREVPAPWRPYADLPFEPRVAAGVTLSTFHGCPPPEIEQIARFLLQDAGLPVVLKLNPTLLGYPEVVRLLHHELGYWDIRPAREAFHTDLQWEPACALVERLDGVARAAGLSLGVKLTNTLVVENEGDALPASEPRKYLSGPPLHVLAMHLVGRFRQAFGTRIPLSFSGGIDARNFPDAVALGLVPVTVCTDLLKPGGYARGQKYFRELARRMRAAGASRIEELILRTGGARGLGPPTSLEAAIRLNTEHYVAGLAASPRYSASQHARMPRKVGRELWLFDCLACDKCVPICPNDANFAFTPPAAIPRETALRADAGWRTRLDGEIALTAPHQVANFADACNDCGHCDAFCPEDGGPQAVKPRFFGALDRWRGAAPADGFCLERTADGDRMYGRIAGVEYAVSFRPDTVRYEGAAFRLEFRPDDPAGTIGGDGPSEVDLTPYHLMAALRAGMLAAPGTNFVNSLLSEGP